MDADPLFHLWRKGDHGMSDWMTRLGVLALRPVERFWSWQYDRAHRKGKYLRPRDEKQAVTTKQ
jgi:hypothetical protein